jgi:CRISPR-associated protein Csm4
MFLKNSDGSVQRSADGSSVDEEQTYLSVYARIAAGFEPLLLELFRELARVGFGADASTGKGQFEIVSDWEDAGWLDRVIENRDGIVVLSSFQPAAGDPTEGYCVKYGKVGPDFGLAHVFRRPLLMLRPGACFKTPGPQPFIGRAVSMDAPAGDYRTRASSALRGADISVVLRAHRFLPVSTSCVVI